MGVDTGTGYKATHTWIYHPLTDLYSTFIHANPTICKTAAIVSTRIKFPPCGPHGMFIIFVAGRKQMQRASVLRPPFALGVGGSDGAADVPALLTSPLVTSSSFPGLLFPVPRRQGIIHCDTNFRKPVCFSVLRCKNSSIRLHYKEHQQLPSESHEMINCELNGGAPTSAKLDYGSTVLTEPTIKKKNTKYLISLKFQAEFFLKQLSACPETFTKLYWFLRGLVMMSVQWLDVLACMSLVVYSASFPHVHWLALTTTTTITTCHPLSTKPWDHWTSYIFALSAFFRLQVKKMTGFMNIQFPVIALRVAIQVTHPR